MQYESAPWTLALPIIASSSLSNRLHSMAIPIACWNFPSEIHLKDKKYQHKYILRKKADIYWKNKCKLNKIRRQERKMTYLSSILSTIASSLWSILAASTFGFKFWDLSVPYSSKALAEIEGEINQDSSQKRIKTSNEWNTNPTKKSLSVVRIISNIKEWSSSECIG